MLLGAHVEFLALIDVEKEGRRLGLVEFLTPAFGGVDQIGERGLAEQKLDPAMLLLHPLRISRIVLPGIEERLHQRLEWIGAGLDREKAPLAAVLKDRRPNIRRAQLLGPCLALECCKYTGLRERGFADPRIANEDRQPVRSRESIKHLDRFRLRPKK